MVIADFGVEARRIALAWKRKKDVPEARPAAQVLENLAVAIEKGRLEELFDDITNMPFSPLEGVASHEVLLRTRGMQADIDFLQRSVLSTDKSFERDVLNTVLSRLKRALLVAPRLSSSDEKKSGPLAKLVEYSSKWKQPLLSTP